MYCINANTGPIQKYKLTPSPLRYREHTDNNQNTPPPLSHPPTQNTKMPFSLAVSCYGDRMALMSRSSRVQGGSCPFGKMQYLRPLPQNNPRSAVLLPYRSYSRLGMWTWRPVYVRPTTDFSPYRPKRCVSWLSVSLPSTCRSLSILIPPPPCLQQTLCAPPLTTFIRPLLAAFS